MGQRKKKILVLTDDMPWGHRSIAKAIYGYLREREKENNWQVRYAEVKAEIGTVGMDLYQFISRYSPGLNRWPNKLFSSKAALKLLERVCVVNLPRLKRLVGWMKPDLVISTFYYHSHTLSKWRRKEGKDFKLWTVAADPRTISVVNFIKGVDVHLVYDEVVEKQAVNFGIEEKKILKTGWWVREEMYKKYDREKIRRKLGFFDDRPVVFVGGGSLGTNSLTRLLPALMLTKKPVGVIVNTGTDKLAYRLVESYVKLFSKIKRTKELVKIKNMGWIDNMAEILTAADIVFGKAGPNFLFDVVAAGKPFVAITHVGGQEDGNIDLIRKKKLGWVREKNGAAARLLLSYLKNPKVYEEKFVKNIRAEAGRNKESLAEVAKEVKRVLS